MLKNIRVPHEVKHQQTSPVGLSMDRRVGLSSNISPRIVVYTYSQQIEYRSTMVIFVALVLPTYCNLRVADLCCDNGLLLAESVSTYR